MQKTILITGGSGLIGGHLAKHLVQKNYRVIILTRNPTQQKSNSPLISYAHWNPGIESIDADAFAKANAIINLAGAGVVDKRWTTNYKKEIVESRVNSGKTLLKALKQIPNKIEVVISASAIGWYGADRPGHVFTETDEASNNFLAQTCLQWENSIAEVSEMGVRLVTLRVGIVLAPNGGAFAEFIKPLKFHTAAIISNGRQTVSWVHIDDLCKIMIYALENDKMKGVFNAVAPHPVSNELLTRTIANALHGKAYLPVHVPAFVLQIMLGESSIEVLKSTNVSASKMLQHGFLFEHPTIEMAVKQLTSK